MMKTTRYYLSIFWLILGAVLLLLSVMQIVDQTMFSGMGGALMAVGIIRLLQYRRYQTNKDYQEKVDISISDERNHYIRLHSWAYAGYIFVLVNALGSLAAFLLKQQMLSQYCLYSIGLIVVFYWISYFILNKKY